MLRVTGRARFKYKAKPAGPHNNTECARGSALSLTATLALSKSAFVSRVLIHPSSSPLTLIIHTYLQTGDFMVQDQSESRAPSLEPEQGSLSLSILLSLSLCSPSLTPRLSLFINSSPKVHTKTMCASCALSSIQCPPLSTSGFSDFYAQLFPLFLFLFFLFFYFIFWRFEFVAAVAV